jgi:hypothetical protein
MKFDLFGFEYWRGSGFGIWLLAIETDNNIRSLFMLYNSMGGWQLTLLFLRVF